MKIELDIFFACHAVSVVPEMEIVNIVATVTLDQPLDLNALQALLPGSKMPATRFPWLQYRLAPENFYIPFYRSGKFLITGIRSLGEIEPVADRVIALLNSAGLEVIATAITVHNIIAVDCLAAAIPMDRVFEALLSIGEWVEYEPEQFPGMIVKRDGASFLLFPTGKLVVTGVKDRERIVRAIEGLRSLISGIL